LNKSLRAGSWLAACTPAEDKTRKNYAPKRLAGDKCILSSSSSAMKALTVIGEEIEVKITFKILPPGD